MRIWHISDTHTYEWLLDVPENIDLIIHSGDASNFRDSTRNSVEMLNFLHWFEQLPIRHKIYVAGNHDSAIEERIVCRDQFSQRNIIYLENESCVVEGINIYGTPITPIFNSWCFMAARDKMFRVWDQVPENTDILITHGPPKGILDFTYNRAGLMEMCGCKNLRTRLDKGEFPNLKLLCFGHIHNYKDIVNAGIRTIPERECLFSNGSVVEDGQFGMTVANGNLFEINEQKQIKHILK